MEIKQMIKGLNRQGISETGDGDMKNPKSRDQAVPRPEDPMSNLPRDINHWEVKTKPKQLRPSGGPKEWAEHPAKASNTSWLTTVKLQKERIRRLGRD